MIVPCLYCGHPAEDVDYVVSLSLGGTNDLRNRVPACKSCIATKGSLPVDVFLRDHPEVRDRVRRYQAAEDVLTSLQPGEKPGGPRLGAPQSLESLHEKPVSSLAGSGSRRHSQ
ncbi:HNH endonuclease [Roseomonas sp. GCM10028921]